MSDHVPFYLTRSGRVFYEHTMPQLVEQLKRLNELLEGLLTCEPAEDDGGDPPCRT